MRNENNQFDIALRDERGLLVYNREAVRNFCTEKENALDDEYMEKFLELFSKRERGEISDEEYKSLVEEMDNEWLEASERLYDEEFGGGLILRNKLTCWKDVRDKFMTPQEQVECQTWLDELGKLMNARDAGEINAKEYCRLCFELDKKYGLADDEDADFYLNTDNDVEKNEFNSEFAFVGG